MSTTLIIRRPTRNLRIASWLGIGCLVCTSLAQTPVPEGNNAHPSWYMYPLRTWDASAVHHSSLGKIRPPRLSPDKLQSIVIPHVEFRNTSLRDAVEYLREESRRLDPDPDPENRGVNIFLRFPKRPIQASIAESIPGLPLALVPPASSGLPPTGAGPQSRVSITFDRLPLLDALKYVASQVGMKVQVEQYAVSIAPMADETLVTAEYRVLPEVLGLPAEPNNSLSHSASPIDGNTIRWPGMKGWFDAKAIPFPPGASATYLGSVNKLVVRNTQENLDKIAALISPAPQPSAPTPANP